MEAEVDASGPTLKQRGWEGEGDEGDTNVFNALRKWLEEPDDEAVAAAEADRERRLDQRYDFSGHIIRIRDRRGHSVIHLKDISCKGASGITELPVAVGSVVFLEVKPKRFFGAEVRWVRSAKIGLRFIRPLQPDMVEKEHEAHKGRVARAAHKKRR
jgi:hypothetical protein